MDPIADMLTQIRNAQAVGHKSRLIRFSKIKEKVLEILKEEEYIKDYRTEEKNDKKSLRALLLYGADQTSAIRSIKRISTPGRRVYSPVSNLRPILKGMGLAVISTSKGLMTDVKARKEGLGGEVICEIY